MVAGRRHGLKPVNIMTAEAAITLLENEDFLEGLGLEDKEDDEDEEQE